jgi:hypothetical protein
MRNAVRILAVLAGLAAPLAAQREPVVVVLPGQPTRVVSDEMGTPIAHAAPRHQVFQALIKAYKRLDIPITLEDSVGGTVGNLKFHKSRKLGGEPISSYLSCGSGMTGPHADTYRVYMAVRSVAAPGRDGETILRSLFFAGALDVAGGAKKAMPCESNGRFEILIGMMVQAELDAPL